MLEVPTLALGKKKKKKENTVSSDPSAEQRDAIAVWKEGETPFPGEEVEVGAIKLVVP